MWWQNKANAVASELLNIYSGPQVPAVKVKQPSALPPRGGGGAEQDQKTSDPSVVLSASLSLFFRLSPSLALSPSTGGGAESGGGTFAFRNVFHHCVFQALHIKWGFYSLLLLLLLLMIRICRLPSITLCHCHHLPAPHADFEPPPVWKSQAGLVISSAGDKRRRRGRGVYLLANTGGDDECGRYQADASQPLIKRRFDDAAQNNGLSVSPSPAASRRPSLEQRARVGGC